MPRFTKRSVKEETGSPYNPPVVSMFAGRQLSSGHGAQNIMIRVRRPEICSAPCRVALRAVRFSPLARNIPRGIVSTAPCCTVVPRNPVNHTVERPLPLSRPLTHKRACKLPPDFGGRCGEITCVHPMCGSRGPRDRVAGSSEQGGCRPGIRAEIPNELSDVPHPFSKAERIR